MLGPSIVTVLRSRHELADIPIRPIVLDDADELPGIIYDIESITSLDCLSGPTGQYQASYLIESISSIRAEAEELDLVVREAMLAWAGDVAGVISQGMSLAGVGDDAGWSVDADETPVFRTSSRFRVLFTRAT